MKAKTLVIGAGFTGLLLASGRDDVVVVAPKHEHGGLIRSSTKDGFKFDLGGHVYTGADTRVANLMSKVGATFHERRKAFYDLETMVPFPVQDNAEMLGIDIDPGFGLKSNHIGAMAESVNRFGIQFVEEFLEPFNKRVWTTSLNAMDSDWMRGRVKLPTENKRNWGMNESFFYASGDKIISFLDDNAKKNGASFIDGRVTEIDGVEKKVTLRDGSQIWYETLIDTAATYSPYSSNFVLSIGIGFEERIPFDFHWVYPHLSSIIHRVSKISRYEEGMAPAGCDSLLLEIPCRFQLPAMELLHIFANEDNIQGSAKLALAEAGFNQDFISRSKIATVWGGISRGYPIQTIGIRQRVAKQKRSLAAINRFLAGRWGSHLYANLQHLFDDAEAVNAFSMGYKLAADDYFESKFYYER